MEHTTYMRFVVDPQHGLHSVLYAALLYAIFGLVMLHTVAVHIVRLASVQKLVRFVLVCVEVLFASIVDTSLYMLDIFKTFSSRAASIARTNYGI